MRACKAGEPDIKPRSRKLQVPFEISQLRTGEPTYRAAPPATRRKSKGTALEGLPRGAPHARRFRPLRKTHGGRIIRLVFTKHAHHAALNLHVSGWNADGCHLRIRRLD